MWQKWLPTLKSSKRSLRKAEMEIPMEEFKSGIIKDLADHIRHHPENVLRNFSEVAARIEDERFAAMIPHLYFVYSASKIGIEKFYTAKDSLGYGMVSIAFRKGFPHMEKVNWIIHRITECALYSKTVDEYIFSSRLKAPPPKPTEDKRALSLDDVKTALWLLVLFHTLSTVCLFIEIGIHRHKTHYSGRKKE
ncbi:glutamate receptor ionotropic, delta-1 [Trichonephila clavipes]|nr:glutamate receptor ionotropic, delta-1 [Trichonephila clavipes]